jgi:hypothetical protein
MNNNLQRDNEETDIRKFISVLLCLRFSTPIKMGKVCWETDFSGRMTPARLEEHQSLEEFSLVLTFVYVKITLFNGGNN